MFSLNQWLKTPDVDGRYQLIVRDFQAAIPEVLDALPRKYFQQPVSWMTESSTNSTTSHSWPREGIVNRNASPDGEILTR